MITSRRPRHTGDSAQDGATAAEPGTLSLTIQSTADMPQGIEHVTAAMTKEGFAEKDVYEMRLALQEAVANAVKHGNQGDPAKQVKVRCRVTAEKALAEVEDEGPGFDPRQTPDPLAPENMGQPGGRGLFLMRSCLTWLRYNARGNRVTLCKRRPGA